MFEKEAEEWVKENMDCCKTDNSVNQPIPYFDEEERCCAKSAFKDGAEFGYNKANEWHKPSERLPEECSLVLAYLFEETEPTICEYVVSDQWECLPKRIVYCSNDQVRKWKEIVLPKERVHVASEG